MLPAKWDRKLHDHAVESLGFDPESPMIKMEIASIIGRGLGGRGYPSTPFGYQELIIESEPDTEEPAVNESEPEALESEMKVSGEPGDSAESEQGTLESTGETVGEAETVEEAGDAVAKEVEDTTGESEPVEKAVEAVEAVEENTEKADQAEKVEEKVEAVSGARDSDKGQRSGVDPNLIRKMMQEDAGHGEVGDGKRDEDVMGAMRSTAFLTLGLLVFVVILGVAVLARARRR
jgi:hypothetical protein